MKKLSDPSAHSSPAAEAREGELRDILRRCSPQTIDAAIRFHRQRNPDLIDTIVLGIMAWFLDKSSPAEFGADIPDMRIVEDLGVDSLLLLEIIVVLEDVFSISISDQDFENLTTLSEVTGYIQQRSSNSA